MSTSFEPVLTEEDVAVCKAVCWETEQRICEDGPYEQVKLAVIEHQKVCEECSFVRSNISAAMDYPSFSMSASTATHLLNLMEIRTSFAEQPVGSCPPYEFARRAEGALSECTDPKYRQYLEDLIELGTWCHQHNRCVQWC